MKIIAEYLVSNPLIAIFLCLGIGYLVGKIKIGSFSFGATASTLIIAMLLCLFVGQYAVFKIDSILRTAFFAMFSFTLGFEVGPSFFKALRSSGVKIVVLSFVYAAVTGLTVLLAGKLLGHDSATITGLFAGAFTQSAILGDDPSEKLLLAYTMTYFVGTIGSIVYARYFVPMLLRVDLLKETKKKSDSMSSSETEETDNTGIIQVRAYKLANGCGFSGKTVTAIENAVNGSAEVEAIYRNDAALSSIHEAVLCDGDVITVVGDITALNKLDELELTEVSEPKYFRIKQSDAQIVLTTDVDEEIYRILTAHGILIKEAEISGKHKKNIKNIDLKKGDILHVYGPDNAIKQAVAKLGYIKDNGITTDIPFLSFALMLSFIIGSVSFVVMGKSIGLGASFGALIVGLICGWLYDKKPKFGHITPGTRWFVKSIGLNLYIAALGLTSSLTLSKLFSLDNLILLAVGAALSIIARIPIMYFGKYILKLDTVDLIGGMCGGGTNTPALNAVTEYTGSSLFTLSFAPGYAVGNVALIAMGLILGNL